MPVPDIMKKISAGREYRRFDVDSLEIRTGDADDGSMTIDGYAATFGQRYELWREDNYVVYEEIDSKAFDGCDMSDVIMQYDHAGRVFARLSNGTLTVAPDDHGLHIRANLSGTELGRQLYQEIRDGYTTKMSFGFTVDKDERSVIEDHDTGRIEVVRKITRIRKLYDVSAVSLPANDTTEISARSYSDGVIQELAEESRRRAKRTLELKIRLLEVRE